MKTYSLMLILLLTLTLSARSQTNQLDQWRSQFRVSETNSCTELSQAYGHIHIGTKLRVLENTTPPRRRFRTASVMYPSPDHLGSNYVSKVDHESKKVFHFFHKNGLIVGIAWSNTFPSKAKRTVRYKGTFGDHKIAWDPTKPYPEPIGPLIMMEKQRPNTRMQETH